MELCLDNHNLREDVADEVVEVEEVSDTAPDDTGDDMDKVVVSP